MHCELLCLCVECVAETVVLYCSAILYQEQRRYDEAIDSYKMAIQCRPRLTSKLALVQRVAVTATAIIIVIVIISFCLTPCLPLPRKRSPDGASPD